MSDLKNLANMIFEYKCRQSPTVPRYAMVKPKPHDTNTSGLTDCVRSFLIAKGFFCGRTNTTGTYSQKLGKYIHSGATRGQSDLNAIVNGQSWQIEIKYGTDKLSIHQQRIRDQVTSAGGKFIVAKTFDGFLKEYQSITNDTEPFKLKKL